MNIALLKNKLTKTSGCSFSEVFSYQDILHAVLNRFLELRKEKEVMLDSQADAATSYDYGFEACGELFTQAISDVSYNLSFIERNLYKK